MATATQAVNRALYRVGTIESPNGSNCQIFGAAYGFNCVAWCNIFVSQIIHDVSGGYSIQGGQFSYTVSHARKFQAMGRWGTTPRLGALVFFDWGGTNTVANIDHVGMVRGPRRSDGLVPTVEGNTRANGTQTRDGVWLVNRSDRYIVGYGYPLYSTTTAPAPAVQGTVTGAFPLSSGWYGVDDGTASSHSGHTSADRFHIQQIQKETGATVDGSYGTGTRSKVLAWQTAHKTQIADHSVDGRVGRNTWNAMVSH